MGSSDFVAWAAEGFLTGDPIQLAAAIAVFWVTGVWTLITGRPF